MENIIPGLSVNSFGRLQIEGHDTVELANKYATPLYVMNEKTVRTNCNLYKESFNKYYENKALTIYASKAFSCLEMCRIIHSENMGLDVVSLGELYTAYKAGFPMNRIFFHGNNKTLDELREAVNLSVGRIIADNIEEIITINNIAANTDKKANIMIRLNPGVEAHTHKSIQTGQMDSKFGISIKEAFSAIPQITTMPHINLCGIHCHIGSQIFDTVPFVAAADKMVEFISDVNKTFGFLLKELNLGGGFAVKYTQNDNPPSANDFIQAICDEVKIKSKLYNIPLPFLMVEPGRSIVCNAGITLYKVGTIKDIPNIRKYVCIDGGMCDNPRYALYGSKYTSIIANRANMPRNTKITIAGKCCESGDIIGEYVDSQEPRPHDILAVLCTGAYNYSMASNYNRIPKPAVIMVNSNTEKIIVSRETLDDIILNDT